MQKNSGKSMAVMLLAMTIFGSVSIILNKISVPSGVIGSFRGFIGAAFLWAAARLQKRDPAKGLDRKKLPGLLLAGVLLGFNWALLFESFHYTTVPVANLCLYMEPTIVILLSPLFFRERLTVRKIGCVLAAALGMALVSGVAEKGLPSAGEAKGIVLALGSGLMYALMVIVNKKNGGVDAYLKTSLELITASTVMIPYALVSGQFAAAELTASSLFWILVVGAVHTGLTFGLYFWSIDGLRAQTVAVLSYAEPVTALFLSALVLGEVLTPLGLLGAAMIIGAAFAGETEPDTSRSAGND